MHRRERHGMAWYCKQKWLQIHFMGVRGGPTRGIVRQAALICSVDEDSCVRAPGHSWWNRKARLKCRHRR